MRRSRPRSRPCRTPSAWRRRSGWWPPTRRGSSGSSTRRCRRPTGSAPPTTRPCWRPRGSPTSTSACPPCGRCSRRRRASRCSSASRTGRNRLTPSADRTSGTPMEIGILVAPFITGNPKATLAADELDPTQILLTHGHQDHYGDVEDIARRTGAPILAMVEIADELSEKGFEVFDPNFGGTVAFDWGWVKMVPAWHSSTTPGGTVSPPAGLLMMVGDTLVYHLGDTALFSDLKLIAQRGNHVDVALVPIGGHYTMDRFDAVTACEWIGADVVIPIHHDTFPPIETDAEAFKSDVENATESKVVVLAPGETHTVR